MNRKLGIALATVAAAVAPLVAVQASATNVGTQGCTPGYWKNHTGNWWEDADRTVPAYLTTDSFGSVFGVDSSMTLIEALQGGGGGGLDGARKILARAATAAVLNASHEGLGYPLRREIASPAGPAIIPTVRETWTNGDRTQILALAAQLDALNNSGCPLN